MCGRGRNSREECVALEADARTFNINSSRADTLFKCVNEGRERGQRGSWAACEGWTRWVSHVALFIFLIFVGEHLSFLHVGRLCFSTLSSFFLFSLLFPCSLSSSSSTPSSSSCSSSSPSPNSSSSSPSSSSPSPSSSSPSFLLYGLKRVASAALAARTRRALSRVSVATNSVRASKRAYKFEEVERAAEAAGAARACVGASV